MLKTHGNNKHIMWAIIIEVINYFPIYRYYRYYYYIECVVFIYINVLNILYKTQWFYRITKSMEPTVTYNNPINKWPVTPNTHKCRTATFGCAQHQKTQTRSNESHELRASVNQTLNKRSI